MKWSDSDWLLLHQCFEIAPSVTEAVALASKKLGRTRNAIDMKIRAKTGLSQSDFYTSVSTKRHEVSKEAIEQVKTVAEQKPSKSEITTALIIPDCHIPFEDQKAYQLMIESAKYIRDHQGLHEIVILGDYVDFFGFSFHDKNPNFAKPADLLTREIDCANIRLDELDREFPEARKKFLEGNHEFRLKRYIEKYAPMLDGMKKMNVPGQLGLENRPHWSFYPFHHMQHCQVMETNLFARHCPPVGGTDFNVAKQAGDSIIYGHTHQKGYAEWHTKVLGRKVVAINAGCLVDFQSSVFNYVKTRPNWAHSWTFIASKGAQWAPHQITVNKDYSCYLGGRRFEVAD